MEEELPVDPLEDLQDGSDLEENLTELDDSSDSSFDESCSETSPMKAQTVRLLPPRPAPGRGQSRGESGSGAFEIRRPLGQQAPAPERGQSRGECSGGFAMQKPVTSLCRRQSRKIPAGGSSKSSAGGSSKSSTGDSSGVCCVVCVVCGVCVVCVVCCGLWSQLNGDHLIALY